VVEKLASRNTVCLGIWLGKPSVFPFPVAIVTETEEQESKIKQSISQSPANVHNELIYLSMPIRYVGEEPCGNSPPL
jgi:hypothetical protein